MEELGEDKGTADDEERVLPPILPPKVPRRVGEKVPGEGGSGSESNTVWIE